ncbi:MAG TPA: YgiT-type zinc finger protein [Longimicrobium sp.]|nr:YgiT-type zinc finger protein [Longimicrobium sp.]
MRYDNDERMVDRLVTYTMEYQGRVVIIENVPARVHPETGARYFSSGTVGQLQAIIWSGREPDRVVQTPVFEFAA